MTVIGIGTIPGIAEVIMRIINPPIPTRPCAKCGTLNVQETKTAKERQIERQ